MASWSMRSVTASNFVLSTLVVDESRLPPLMRRRDRRLRGDRVSDDVCSPLLSPSLLLFMLRGLRFSLSEPLRYDRRCTRGFCLLTAGAAASFSGSKYLSKISTSSARSSSLISSSFETISVRPSYGTDKVNESNGISSILTHAQVRMEIYLFFLSPNGFKCFQLEPFFGKHTSECDCFVAMIQIRLEVLNENGSECVLQVHASLLIR